MFLATVLSCISRPGFVLTSLKIPPVSGPGAC
jgi:hypothetical protein